MDASTRTINPLSVWQDVGDKVAPRRSQNASPMICRSSSLLRDLSSTPSDYEVPTQYPSQISRQQFTFAQPQRSQTDVSQLSSHPSSPTSTRPLSIRRSPSPCSDKEATPPGSSIFFNTPPQSDFRLSYSDKEVLPTSIECSYQPNHASWRHQSQQISSIDHSAEADLRVIPTSNPPTMDWFKRNSQRRPPTARSASIATADEKRTLDMEQTTGVIAADEKLPMSMPESSLSAQISEARSARVNAVVDTYIQPLIQEQASNGITQFTIVLVPEVQKQLSFDANPSPDSKHELLADFGSVLPRSESHDMLVGFPTELNVQVVRLHPAHSNHTGHSGRARDALGDQGSRFWHQPAARDELDRLLKIRLVGMGLDVIDPAGLTAPFRRQGWTERGEQVGGTPNVEPVATGTKGRWKGDGWQAGLGIWRHGGTNRAQSSWEMATQEQLSPGQASVRVTLEEVCFRVQSDLGLYDTKTDKALVVRINIEA